MSDHNKPATKKARVRKAKGAAREAIGKLIGDDLEVREGRAEQKHAAGMIPSKSNQQE